MRKKYLAITIIASLLPQTALAHFETNHEPFWHEPVHWLMQHYFIATMIGIGMLGTAIYLKKKSEKE